MITYTVPDLITFLKAHNRLQTANAVTYNIKHGLFNATATANDLSTLINNLGNWRASREGHTFWEQTAQHLSRLVFFLEGNQKKTATLQSSSRPPETVISDFLRTKDADLSRRQDEIIKKYDEDKFRSTAATAKDFEEFYTYSLDKPMGYADSTIIVDDRGSSSGDPRY